MCLLHAIADAPVRATSSLRVSSSVRDARPRVSRSPTRPSAVGGSLWQIRFDRIRRSTTLSLIA